MKKETTQNTENQAVREQLQKGNVSFTIKGITGYRKGEDGEYRLKEFKVDKKGESINVDEFFGDGMNVTKWGTTCVTLYTYNMLGKRSVGKIKYSDINITK